MNTMSDAKHDLCCPLGKAYEGKKLISSPERDNPPNREIAFCFQFHDTVINMWQAAHISHNDFLSVLERLETQIKCYRELIKGEANA